MCTVSWFADASGYHVFFNRDEQKSRPIAQPPRVFHSESGNYVMPVDPLGGGSWISVNQCGLTVALLNFYQGKTPKGELVSRGLIVKELAVCKEVDEAVTQLYTFDLQTFAPFTILLISQNQLSHHSRARALRWDGRELLDFASASPLISSAFDFKHVSKQRLELYRAKISPGHGKSHSVDEHCAFHSSHLPTASAYSVCMHREDAQTVSFCHICVGDREIVFNYTDGPPCENEIRYDLTLTRHPRGECLVDFG